MSLDGDHTPTHISGSMADAIIYQDLVGLQEESHGDRITVDFVEVKAPTAPSASSGSNVAITMNIPNELTEETLRRADEGVEVVVCADADEFFARLDDEDD